MSRLYLILICLIGFNFNGGAQVKLKDLISFAEEQYKKGDYYYACDYYQQALAIDSNSLELRWKYAETLRAYKNYRAAEEEYAKIYAFDEGVAYPNALLYLGLMQKQNGKYKIALASFKLAKTAFEDPTKYEYKKIEREIASCYWAIQQGPDTTSIEHFDERINTYDAEFGHQLKDGKLIFSSLKADTINAEEEVYAKHYTTALYSVSTEADSTGKPKKIQGLSQGKSSVGNASFDEESGYFYFSICNDEAFNYNCKIARLKIIDGKWGKADTLSSIINAPNSNTTHPMVHIDKEGRKLLYFSSNRSGGKGEMDIWCCEIIGDGFGSAFNVNQINSIENEICPWFDQKNQRLYFSSTWHNNFGGYDVNFADINGEKISKPKNAGRPINSPANDLYYFESKDSVFVSSNRLGSFAKKNPTCCSDIYFQIIPKPILPPDTLIVNQIETIFPVKIYFENDHPNPKSWAKTSNLKYSQTLEAYQKMFPTYLAKGDSIIEANSESEKLSVFFNFNVNKGYQDLLKLSDTLILYLSRGERVRVFVSGMASPLHQSQYNVNLSQRRIETLLNEWRKNENPILNAALINKQIEIIEIPFGEYLANQETSDDLNNKAQSVYSYDASIERRVEIVGIDKNKELVNSALKVQPMIVHLKKSELGKRIAEFTIKNNSLEPQTISAITSTSPALIVIGDKLNEIVVAPQSEIMLKVTVDISKLVGLQLHKLQINFTDSSLNTTIYISTEN